MRPILRARPLALALAAVTALASCDSAAPLAPGNGRSAAPEEPRYATAPFPSPAGFTAQGPGIDSTARSVTLAWEDVPGDQGYLVQWRREGSQVWRTLVTTGANRTGFVTDSLSLSEPNFYRVAVFTSDFRTGEFATLRLRPGAFTQAALLPSDSVATLSAYVRPNGGGNSYWFEYGTDPSLAGAAKTPVQNLYTSNVALRFVTQSLKVAPGTVYYFRAAASNTGGASFGEIRTFTAAASVPAAPTGVTAVFSASPVALNGGGLSAAHNVAVRWTHDGTQAATFRVQRRRVGMPSWVQIQPGVLAPSSRDYFDRRFVDPTFPVTADAEYDYRVLACNAQDGCAASAEVRVALEGLDAPGGLTATQGQDGRVVLAWQDLPSEEAFAVQWRAGDTGAWQPLVSTGKNATTYTTDRVTAGVPNHYRVAGEVRSFRMGAFAEVVLTAGAGRTLEVGTSSAELLSSTSARVRGVATPGGLPATAWFQWGTDPALAGASQTPGQAVGSGLVPVAFDATIAVPLAQTYYYRAVASNSAGTVLGPIRTFAAGPPSAPVLTVVYDSARFEINGAWTYSGAVPPTEFRVERRTTGQTAWTAFSTTPPAGRFLFDSRFGVDGPLAFDYRVRACNAAGECTASNVAAVRTSTLAAPAGLTAARTADGQVTLSWQDVAGEVAYLIQVRTSTAAPWMPVVSTGANRTQYTGRAIQAGTTNYYRVVPEASLFRQGIPATTSLVVP